MSEEVFDAGFVSMTILKLFGEVAKITGLTTPPPDLRLIGIAIVLARALKSISHPDYRRQNELVIASR
ncbi:MAG: hypothetical protein P4M15_13705 [Alphaproteobacteria bacterium]|nr:hypothetical protein [Alphaproteobacteria bacterium]